MDVAKFVEQLASSLAGLSALLISKCIIEPANGADADEQARSKADEATIR